MDLTLVIPAFNEAESLPLLFEKIDEAVSPMGLAFEVLIIDDGSKDQTFAVLKELKQQYSFLKAIRFRRNYGKSAALSEGFKAATGKFVITMDADLQDDPNEVPNLIAKLEEGFDLVSGWKKERKDPLSKRLPSKLYNRVTSMLSGIRLHDFNCGLKAYRNEVVKSLSVYGELHRFLPVLSHQQGFRVTEMAVKHHPRQFGKSKFGMWRFFSGFFDLMTVMFLTHFKARPLHVFGMIGAPIFLLGNLIEAYLTVGWFMGVGIRNRPLFFLGILLIIVGIQFIGTGLVAEMISAGFSENMRYSVRERIE